MSRITRTFLAHAGAHPERTALWCDGRSFSYGQLATLVQRWVEALASGGVRRGDALGVLLPNSVEFAALLLAASWLGVVLAPLNTTLPPPLVQRAFRAAEVRHVIATAGALRTLRGPEAPDFSFANGSWLSVDDPVAGCGTLGLLRDDRPERPLPGIAGQDGDPLILTMTSGSTGEPKPIVLNQLTKLNRAGAAAEMYGITSADRTLAATPLYHSLAERLVLIPWLTGGTSVLLARYSPSVWLQCVEEQRVTFTIAVSSQLRQIARHLAEGDSGGKLGSLRCVVTSSEQLEPGVKADLLSRLRCQFHECYGTSEIAIATNLDHGVDRSKLGSVGRPAPGVDVRILAENGEPAAAGTIGEIVCRTPMIFAGYFKRPDLTRQAMWGDYFRTGDLGWLDPDGYLFFAGRKKEIVISGGINIYPKDVETALLEHPAVRESAAFAYPDDRLGEVVAVAIVPRDPERFSLREIRRHCAGRLADFQQPRLYFVLEELPKNEVGKVSKKALYEHCRRQSPAAGGIIPRQGS